MSVTAVNAECMPKLGLDQERGILGMGPTGCLYPGHARYARENLSLASYMACAG